MTASASVVRHRYIRHNEAPLLRPHRRAKSLLFRGDVEGEFCQGVADSIGVTVVLASTENCKRVTSLEHCASNLTGEVLGNSPETI